MRLSRKQQLELDAIKYFIPGWVDFQPITEKDIEQFFAWSDRGVPLPINPNLKPLTGLHALYFGKRYRDLHITTFLDDWGNTLLAWDFQEFPRNVAEYLSKRMNKPAIMEAYNEQLAV